MIQRGRERVQAQRGEVGAQPYADAADRGLLRYLQVVVERFVDRASGRGRPAPSTPPL